MPFSLLLLSINSILELFGMMLFIKNNLSSFELNCPNKDIIPILLFPMRFNKFLASFEITNLSSSNIMKGICLFILLSINILIFWLFEIDVIGKVILL